MIIVKTPFRISFFGGGTDYPEYYNRFGGCVLSTTINKYCFITLRKLPPVFDYRNQFTYSKIERFNSPDELNHPLVKATLNYIPQDRIQISYDADLPACSGIGSSSSFAVGLLQGLHAMKNEFPDKMSLAKEAIFIERKMCNEAGGIQDQLAAAFGGLKLYEFNSNDISASDIKIKDDKIQEFNENLLLMFTGFSRFSAIVSEEQKKNVNTNIDNLHEMKSLVYDARNLLECGKFDDFGRLLNYTWKLKRTLSNQISTEKIDEIYLKAIKYGAEGGKLLGAGGGGFMLLYVPKEKQEYLKKNLSDYQFFPFSFEKNGSELIYKSDD